MQLVPKSCLAIEYIQYKILSFPQENVQSVQFVDVPQCQSVASEASLGTRKCCMQLITTHDKKDCDGITNARNT